MLFSLQRYFVSYTIFAAPYKAEFPWQQFSQLMRFFFLVLDDKFDIPGKVVSYPVAEVSQNYFRQEELCKSINLINE